MRPVRVGSEGRRSAVSGTNFLMTVLLFLPTASDLLPSLDRETGRTTCAPDLPHPRRWRIGFLTGMHENKLLGILFFGLLFFFVYSLTHVAAILVAE